MKRWIERIEDWFWTGVGTVIRIRYVRYNPAVTTRTQKSPGMAGLVWHATKPQVR
jgi:hypothetical protein